MVNIFYNEVSDPKNPQSSYGLYAALIGGNVEFALTPYSLAGRVVDKSPEIPSLVNKLPRGYVTPKSYDGGTASFRRLTPREMEVFIRSVEYCLGMQPPL